MGLFRCSHYVPMSDMKNILLERSDQLGGLLDQEYGLIASYEGFCRNCHAFVSLTEEVESRAVYECLKRDLEAAVLKESK